MQISFVAPADVTAKSEGGGAWVVGHGETHHGETHNETEANPLTALY